MFMGMTPEIKARMEFLQNADALDRKNGTPRQERLRQIPPETGKFLCLLAANAPAGAIVEVGTSAGYSTLWLSLAAKQRGDCYVETYEILPAKIAAAKETFSLCSVEKIVHLHESDIRQDHESLGKIAFCFIDCEKEIYSAIWRFLADRLCDGGIIVADNVISHATELQSFVDEVMNDQRFDCVVVPIGKGELVARKKSMNKV